MAEDPVECDCCIPGVKITCKIFFWVFALLMITTVGVLVNYRNVRKRSNKNALRPNQSKFWIIVGVLSLQTVRLIYFSTAWTYEFF